MIALIATDLDGTFLGADKLPSAENTEAMFAAADAGVHVVFATGRPYRWLTVLDPFRPIHPTLLASNGAVSVNAATGKVLHDLYMTPQTVAGIVCDVRQALPHACFVPRRPPSGSPKKGSTAGRSAARRTVRARSRVSWEMITASSSC